MHTQSHTLAAQVVEGGGGGGGCAHCLHGHVVVRLQSPPRPSLTLNTTASLISQQPDGGRKWSFSCLRFCCCCCCFNFLLLPLVVEATLSLRTVITACLSFSLFPPSVRFPSCMETENPLVLLSPPSALRGAVSRSVAHRRAGRKDLPEYIQRKICFQHVCSIVGIMSY